MSREPNKDFVRDASSRALINTNKRAHQQYLVLREKNRRITNLENDLLEMKEMLKQLMDKVK